MSAPNRRAILLAGLAAPAVATTPAGAQPAHDPAAWSALLANYHALYDAEIVRSRRHSEAEEHAMRLRRRATPPKPGELCVWRPAAVLTRGAERYEVPAERRTFQCRAEVEQWAGANPDEANATLAAWDRWEANCAAADIAAGVLQAERREAILSALFQRAFRRRDAARWRLLSYPTLDHAAVRTKLEIVEDAADPDATTPALANSFLAALGFEERL